MSAEERDEITDDEERLLDLIDDLRRARAVAHSKQRSKKYATDASTLARTREEVTETGQAALDANNEVQRLIQQMTDPVILWRKEMAAS